MKSKVLKSLAVLLAAVMFFSMIPIGTFTVGAATNPYGKYQTIDGVTTVRCTWYAWQAAYDRCGVALPGWGDAGTWYNSAVNAGLSTGSIPKSNSIAVWNQGGNYGHVAFVTSVSGNTMTVDEGGVTYQGSAYNGDGIKTGTVTNSSVGSAKDNWNPNQILVGFIYLSSSSNSGSSTGSHTHSYTEYVYFGKSHPHYKYYKCSCGDIKMSNETISFYELCEECQQSSITVSWSNWAEKYSIGSNNAVLAKRIDTTGVSNGQVTEIGIYLYDSNMNSLANCKDDVSYGKDSYFFAWYDVASELKYNLQPGTTYKYKMYTLIRGKTYESPVETFTTLGSAQSVTVNWSEDSEHYSIGSTNAVLAKRIDLTGATVRDITGIGIRLYDSNKNLLSSFNENVSYNESHSWLVAWYDVNLSTELNYTLISGTTYKYQMYIVVKGKTYDSSIETFTTTGTAPAPSTPAPFVNSIYDEGSTVTITWGAAANAWYYWVSIQKDGNNIVNQSVDANTSYTLSDAEAGSYNVSIKAINKDYIESGWGSCDFFVCNHSNIEVRNATESTCMTIGYSGDTYCLDCGKLLETGTDLPVAGHNYILSVTAPTCTEQGYTTHTCSVCGDSYIDSYTDAHGHTESDWITDTEAQIGVNGSKHKECTVCHTVLQTEEIPALENPAPPIDENAPQIVISSGRAVLGNTINVTVSIKNNPGIASAKLKVAYNSDVFTLTNVTDGGILGTSVHKPQMASPYTLSWVNDTATVNFTADGTLATLTFAVDENAQTGNYPITVSYSYDDYDIYNVDVEPINFATVNGNIEVTDVIIGDVNGDGKVNNLDRVVLTRYLADWDDYPESAVDMIAADVNCDGKVNNLDRVILTRYLADWDDYPELPYIH